MHFFPIWRWNLCKISDISICVQLNRICWLKMWQLNCFKLWHWNHTSSYWEKCNKTTEIKCITIISTIHIKSITNQLIKVNTFYFIMLMWHTKDIKCTLLVLKHHIKLKTLIQKLEEKKKNFRKSCTKWSVDSSIGIFWIITTNRTSSGNW